MDGIVGLSTNTGDDGHREKGHLTRTREVTPELGISQQRMGESCVSGSRPHSFHQKAKNPLRKSPGFLLRRGVITNEHIGHSQDGIVESTCGLDKTAPFSVRKVWEPQPLLVLTRPAGQPVELKLLLFFSGFLFQSWCVYLNNFFFLLFFRATPTTYGGSQARGQIGPIATSLHHSHSKARSEPRLWPTPQLMAMPDP